MQQITVYTAKAIHTMNPSLPLATAVAMSGDRIIEAGSLERPHGLETRSIWRTICGISSSGRNTGPVQWRRRQTVPASASGPRRP